MNEQVIDKAIWIEFEEELKKIKSKVSISLQKGKIINKSLRQFFEKFLTENFPQGKINKILEKNFGIWICYNEIDIEQIKLKYQEQKWKINGLLGWIKKFQKGEIGTLNIKELLIWSNENNQFEIKQLENAKKEIEMNSQLKLIRDNELENYETPPQSWIVEGLVGAGKIIIIAGKRSVLKTWLMLYLIYCISNGIKFLGKFNTQFDTQKNEILYLDRENGIDELKKRCRMIKKGLKIVGNSKITFLSESPFKLDNIFNLEFLEEFIISNNVKIVIVDTYRRLITYDEDKANFVSKFFVDDLKPLTERTGCSFIFIAHEKKGESSGDNMDMIRGSSDLVNYVDGVIQLTRKGNKLIVNQTKNRGAKELDPFQIEVETDETTYFKFNYMGKPNNIENTLSQLLIDWLIETEKKEFRYTEGLNFAESKKFHKNKFIEAINLLINQGLIEKSGGLKTPYRVCGDLKQLNLGEIEND